MYMFFHCIFKSVMKSSRGIRSIDDISINRWMTDPSNNTLFCNSTGIFKEAIQLACGN